MSNGDDLSPSEISFSVVFTATSVLFDYLQSTNSRDAVELFEEHSSVKVVSRGVKQEFERVCERRKKIHKTLLKYAKKGELDEFDPLGDVRLTSNDWGYIQDLMDELFELTDKVEVVRRLNEERRRLSSGRKAFSESQDCSIDQVCSPNRDPMLQGYLQIDVENSADVRILCDAVAWTLADGSGTFLTSDTDDLISNRSTVAQHIEQYDSDGVLDILSAEQFLELDPDHN